MKSTAIHLTFTLVFGEPVEQQNSSRTSSNGTQVPAARFVPFVLSGSHVSALF